MRVLIMILSVDLLGPAGGPRPVQGVPERRPGRLQPAGGPGQADQGL